MFTATLDLMQKMISIHPESYKEGRFLSYFNCVHNSEDTVPKEIQQCVIFVKKKAVLVYEISVLSLVKSVKFNFHCNSNNTFTISNITPF